MNRESKAVKRYAELRDTKNMTESIDVLVEELARERAIGFNRWSQNEGWNLIGGYWRKGNENADDNQLYSKYEEHLKKIIMEQAFVILLDKSCDAPFRDNNIYHQ